MTVPALEALLVGSPAERRAAVAAVLAGPEGPRRLEAVLVDLLRDADAEVLTSVAGALADHVERPEAVRVLEAFARRGGAVRAVALRVLRGERPVVTSPELLAASTTMTATVHAAAPTPPALLALEAAGSAAAAATPVAAPSATPPAPVVEPAGDDWARPFEVVLADPSAEHVAAAALALVELSDRRPPGATKAALQALAGRLAMASFDHVGDTQQGLARLARGLKAL